MPGEAIEALAGVPEEDIEQTLAVRFKNLNTQTRINISLGEFREKKEKKFVS